MPCTRRSTPSVIATIITLTTLPSLALAHAGDHAAGFMHGVAHVLSGIDHMLAMLAVGLLAGRMGGGVVWWVPASFMVLMAAGGAGGMAGIPMPFVETGIALSIVVFGLLLAVDRNVTVMLASAVVGFFALFHGHAHGTEAASGISGVAYAAGFLMSSASLHAIGIVAARSMTTPMAARVSGGVLMLAGCTAFAGVMLG